MTRTTNNPWLARFALLTALATLVLICLGGLVASHEAGMGVPDWPNTFGCEQLAGCGGGRTDHGRATSPF